MSNRALTWAFAQHCGDVSAKATLVALADFADERNSCWPSQETLCSMTDQSVSSVRRALGRLVDGGLIHREQRRNPDGTRASDRYILCVSVVVATTQPVKVTGSPAVNLTGGQAVSLTGGETAAAQQESALQQGVNLTGGEQPVKLTTGQIDRVTPIERTTTTPSSPPRKRASTTLPVSLLPQFEEWWQAYPRRHGKGAARAAYAKALSKADHRVLLAAAVALSNDPNLPEEQFIAHPATWLNQERWEDAPLPVRETRRGASRPAGPPQQQFRSTEGWTG